MLYVDMNQTTLKVSFPYTLDSVAEEVKSVDILAALPTPPHNQNEDVRYAVEKNLIGLIA